jgi:hypothetical protein
MKNFICVLVTLLGAALSFVGFAHTASPLSFSEKVERSDLILIGRVISMTDLDPESSVVTQFATISIESVIKGDYADGTVRFVTVGYSPEFDPGCCEVGQRYLLFVYRGYKALTETDGGIESVMLEPNLYVSSVNGRYGAYRIEGECVVGWTESHGENSVLAATLDEVIGRINSQVH